MTNEELGTLAYTKSPKTSKRTKFQDELQAAISARAKKVTMDEYSDDFNDDEDDFLNELLKSRKKKVDAFKASKAKVVNFEFSDDEDKPAKSKRVSFLKIQKISSTLEGPQTDEQKVNGNSNSSTDGCSNQSSTNVSDQSSEKRNDVESTHSQDTQESGNRSLPNQMSEDALQDEPPPVETPNSLILGVNESELPRPKPRQRILGLTNQDKQSESQALHMQPTFSSSVPLSSELSNEQTTSRDNPNLADGDHTVLNNRSQSFSIVGEPSTLTTSTVDLGSKDGCNSDNSKDHGLSFEEPTISHPSAAAEDSGDQTDCSVNHPNSHISDNSQDTLKSDTLSKGAQKTHSVFQKKVESKYLGTLKVLDQNLSLQESEPQAADTLRAAVYQEWLKKKREKSKQNKEMKKEEEIIKEKKTEEKEAKREDAKASYEAWKEKKLESLKMKTKEKQEKRRKEQKAREEKEEKKETAKQVFEKWKSEHDHILKDKYRKTRREETEQKLQKQEKEDERKKSNKSAFSEWNEKKKTILQERATAKRKEIKDKVETELYLKEERDKMSLDMYESWLARKYLEKKRHKEERWLQGILEDSPPPPWSPPNKTIPYRK